jgi:hypothetical protein
MQVTAAAKFLVIHEPLHHVTDCNERALEDSCRTTSLTFSV